MNSEIILKEHCESDIPALAKMWNKIVEEGCYFPDEKQFSDAEAKEFFGSQTSTTVAFLNGGIVGFYILHPNTPDKRRCHIANASYGVKSGLKGKGIGRKLVVDSLHKAKERGFYGLQFNAVVDTNKNAMHLYESIGFERQGYIKNGFRLKDNSLTGIYIYYFDFEKDLPKIK